MTLNQRQVAMLGKGIEMDAIRIDSLIFHANGTFAEVVTDLDAFWIPLTPTVGFARFEVVDTLSSRECARTFQLLEVRAASWLAPHPQVSVSGVLWSRRAAIEADQAIGSYLAGLDPTQQFAEQSVPSGCPHEA